MLWEQLVQAAISCWSGSGAAERCDGIRVESRRGGGAAHLSGGQEAVRKLRSCFGAAFLELVL